MIRQMIQNILVYVFMINILQGLVAREGFREIFRFVGGMILIVLCISPVLSQISDSDTIGKFLEERIFREEMTRLKQETKLADGKLESVMLKKCQEELEKEMSRMAEEEGEKSLKVKVKFSGDHKGEPGLEKIQIVLRQETLQTSVYKDPEKISVDRIVVGNKALQGGQKGTDAGTAKLRKKICKKYELPEKKVIVWRKNGEN